MEKTLFTGVTVLDCTGGDPFPGEVLVEGNRIVSVGRAPTQIARENAYVIDGHGAAVLMPGLIESHAHLSIDETDDLAALGRIPPEEHTLLTMRIAKLYLDHGITSCIIQEGYLADLVLVKQDPLKDFRVLTEPDNLIAVMKDGVFHKRPA